MATKTRTYERELEVALWWRDFRATNNAHFLPLLFDRHRYLVLKGGGGSGKSIFAGRKVLERVTSEPGHRWLVCRKVARTLRESCFEQLKKQAYEYYADQIAYAIFLVLVKQVLAMDHIASLIDMQKKSYPLPIAYNYFCMELEKKLIILFEDRDESPLHTDGVSFEKKVLYRVTSAVAQVIYLNDLFLTSDTAS